MVGFADWLSTAGIPGGAAEAGNDADSDGTSNALEFVFGGNPAVKDDSSTVAFAETPDVTLLVEAGPSLGNWPNSYLIGATTGTSAAGVEVLENGGGPDLITVEIPRNSNGAKFARLKVIIGG